MVKLEKSKWLGRNLRKEDWGELGISTWTKIKESLEAGRKQEALDLVDYLPDESKVVHDVNIDWIYHLLTYVANNLGEEKVYECLMETGMVLRKAGIEGAAKIPVEELVQINAENMRAHRSGHGELGNITITEDADKYVMSFDPCGSGGRLRITGENGKPPLTGPPFNFGRTKKAYPWSWGKANVPYYCCHCCVWSEILPIELIGYPLRVCLYNDDPEKPCAWVLYKKPELIPDEYFTRIGKKKDPSKFKSG